MFKRPTTWMVICLLCLAGFVYFWKLGDRWAQEQRGAQSPAARAGAAGKAAVRPAAGAFPESTAPMVLFTTPEQAAAVAATERTNRLKYHLRNTAQSVGQLLRNPHALHLANALIDTRQPVSLNIPAHLRSAGDPGSYVVQARGPLDAAFRTALQDAGAEWVSYIPNNACLVRASAAAAQQLARFAGTQSVLPFEPYYKLSEPLLPAAVARAPMPAGLGLNLVLFAGAADATRQELLDAGVEIVSEMRTPFGPMLSVRSVPENWYALAAMPGVQTIESWQPRLAANDKTRVRMNVSTDTLVQTNYYNLTGSNVMVALVDSGVDATHPDLINRLYTDFASSLVDSNGHGTHIAGIILGSGVASTNPTPVGAMLASMDFGSVSNATFRGKAPGANLFVLPAGFSSSRPGLDTGGGADAYLQESAAATNALISNNSWYYANQNLYSIAAASYDAAVRDALPGVTGSQPVIFVFAAGNAGGGDDDGQAGNSDTIMSPGTAKNVITVGAIEQQRNITNEVIVDCVFTNIDGTNVTICTTNQPWFGMTTADTEVAGFSSRGNVGIGVEGDFGRFKPDVVAPGTFVVSTRSAQWDEKEYYNPTNHHVLIRPDQSVTGTNLHSYSVFVPDNAVGLNLTLLDNTTNMPIYVWKGTDYSSTPPSFWRTNVVTAPPDNAPNFAPVETTWTWAVGNPPPGGEQSNSYTIIRDLITTNDLGNYFEVLSNLNNKISGDPDSSVTPHYYRFESGTSMSAGAVSGMLALMQEYFATYFHRTNSPALMKALLINGARSVGDGVYDFQVQNTRNFQGWGLPRLNYSLPAGLTNFANGLPSSMWFEEQSETNALATGQSKTRLLRIPQTGARNRPLRVSLVWTDPAGNPNAGVKLVNDLDLVVTNLDTGDVYFGNDILAGSAFNSPWNTNAPPNLDSVNNVENVYLLDPLDTNYSITVIAHAVNVNAVTAHTNDVVQDYALVISSAEGQVVSALNVTNTIPIATPDSRRLRFLTNTFSQPKAAGFLLDGQRVGANTPLLGTTNGMTNQWHFFVVTNTTTFTNAAFITFLPTDLSLPRIGVRQSSAARGSRPSADIDLYVSLDPDMTNLAPATVAAASNSRSRGGTEQVVFSNSAAGDVYYLAVKSEDYMAAEFSIFGVFSEVPFGDQEGSVPCFNIPQLIPDRTPDSVLGANNAARVVCPCVLEGEIRRVIATNVISHEHFGDVIGVLDHSGEGGDLFAVLNNHRPPPAQPASYGPYGFIYEDNGEGSIFPPVNPYNGLPYLLLPSDGPESLRGFVGEQRIGPWIFTYVDDSLTATGLVNFAALQIEKEDLSTNAAARDVLPGGWLYNVINVPAGATNLEVCIAGNTQPVELYVRRGAFPTRTQYDKFRVVGPPGGCLSLTPSDLPPLAAGRYFIGVYNSSPVLQTIQVTATVMIDPNSIVPVRFEGGDGLSLLDDAVTNSSVVVTNDGTVASVEVGLRVNHPRISDLAFTLISPRGTRVLLMENRGMTNDAGIGTTFSFTNVVPVVVTNSGPQAVTNVIPTGHTSGNLRIDYNFFTVPDRMTVYYENALLLDTGFINGQGTLRVTYGPGVSTDVTIVMNEGGNPSNTTAYAYTVSDIGKVHNYLTFTENTNKTTTPIKFLAPPYVPPPAAPPVLISGFEVAAGDTVAPALVDGWSVLTNQVTVINDPALAASGNGFLALASATIERTLPTVNGRTYSLSYAYRGPDIVSWWRGEGDYTDSVGGANGVVAGSVNTEAGRVGLGFRLTGDDYSGINVPNVPSLALSNSLTIEGWMYVTNPPVDVDMIVFRGGTGAGFDPYTLAALPGGTSGYLQFRISDPTDTPVDLLADIPLGNWTHIAGTLDGSSGEMRLYTNGVLANRVVTPLRPLGPLAGPDNPGVGLGNHSGSPSWPYGFKGLLDELSIYKRALSASEVKAIYAAGGQGKFDPSAAIPSNLAEAQVVTDLSKTNIVFGDNTTWQTNTVIFQATQTGTLLQIKGVQPGVLLDSFTLAESGSELYALPEQSLSKLTGERAKGTWQLEVWDSRTGKTNTISLESWQLSIVFQNTAVPGVLEHGVAQTNTIPPGQIAYYVVDVPDWAKFATNTLIFATSPVNVLFNQIIPPGIGATNVGDFLLMGPVASGVVTLDGASVPPLVPGQRYYLGVHNPGATAVTFGIQVDFDITPLTNAVPVTSTLAAGTLPRYFSFDVSTNANGVSFQLLNMSGNANLVVRKGLPLPILTSYDYAGLNPGTNNEDIVVLTNSTPVALSAGRWYLGVFNADVAPVTYTILATEYVGLPRIITLTNAIPYFNTNDATGGATDYYRYVVSSTAVRAQFEIYGLSADVTLVARKGLPLPDLATFDYQSANTGTNDELIMLFTNSAPVILSPGEWFLSAVNISGGPAAYTIKATEWPISGRPIVIVDSSIVSNSFCFTWTSLPGVHYYVQGITNLSSTNWVSLPPPVTAVGYLTTWCIPLPSPYHFFRVLEGLDITNAPIAPIITLTNGIPYFSTNTPALSDRDYYRYVVTTNAARVQFEIFGAGADFTLVARKGLPLPSLVTHDYLSANAGTNDELIVVFTNSTPVSLTPGDWYLAAVNLTGTPLPYNIMATEWPVTGRPIVVTDTQVSATNFCITWDSLPGVHYYIEGLTNFSTTNWVIASPTITAVTNSTTYCVPLPSPFQFFRVRDGLAVSPNTFVPAPPVNTTVTAGTNGFTIAWTGGLGARYQVRWTPTLAPPTWTSFTNIITSATTVFTFLDDGAQTGGLGVLRFYQPYQVP